MMSALELFLALAAMLVVGVAIGYYSHPGAARWNLRMREQADSFNAYHIDAKDRIRAANQRATALEAEAAALRSDHADAERTIAVLRRPGTSDGSPADGPKHVTTMVVDKMVVSNIDHEPDLVAPPSAPDSYVAAEHAAETPADDVGEAATTPHEQPPEPPIITAFEMPETLAGPAVMAPTPGSDDEHPTPPEAPAKGWFGSGTRDDLTRIRGIDAALDTRLFSLGVLRFKDIAKLSDEDEMALEQRLSLPVGLIAREQWRAQVALLRASKDVEHADYFPSEGATTE